MNKKHFFKQNGYLTLISILIVGAVGVAIVLSLILSGFGISHGSLVLQQSIRARALANACAEEALQQVRDNSSFNGTGSLTIGGGYCNYEIVNNGGDNRIINVSGSISTVIRKIKIIVNKINPKIILSSWQEVADF